MADTTIPLSELATLYAYVVTGSHKAAAHRLGITPGTSRHRLSSLMSRIGADSTAQAVWKLRRELEEYAR